MKGKCTEIDTSQNRQLDFKELFLGLTAQENPVGVWTVTDASDFLIQFI